MNKDFVKDPESSKEKLITLVKDNMSKLDQVYKRGVQKDEGLEQYVGDLYESMTPCLTQEVVICIFTMLPLVQELDKQRREGKTEEIRQEYDALCSGYEGDELMEVNIDMFRLARMLPVSIWNEYDYDSFHQLAARIQENLGGTKSDLPLDFLDEWSRFLDKHGYDGQDQLFVSSARYIDSPEILLAKLRHNVGDGIKDPAVAQRENLERRRKVMALHEERARKVRWYKPFTLSSIQERNAVLEHLMWIRNSWKIHISRIVGMVRQAMLCIEKEFIENGRLEQPGDIFHLDVEEIDKVLLGEEALDLMDLVRPRKAIYGRAVRSNLCPMLVDSRCRILKPDVETNQEPGTLCAVQFHLVLQLEEFGLHTAPLIPWSPVKC